MVLNLSYNFPRSVVSIHSIFVLFWEYVFAWESQRTRNLVFLLNHFFYSSTTPFALTSYLTLPIQKLEL